MEHYNGLIADNKAARFQLASMEWNALVGIIDTQLQGALVAIGAGVIQGLVVTAGTGLSVDVSAGSGVISLSTALAFVELPDGDTLASLPDDASLWFWAQALVPETSDADSRMDAAARVVYTLDNIQPPCSFPLAHGTSADGAVTITSDDRVYCPARVVASLQAAITALQTAVGIPYVAETSLAARVSSLESAPAGDTGGFRYWGNPGAMMTRAPGNNQTIPEAISEGSQSAVNSHVTQYHAGEVTVTSVGEPWKINAVNQGRSHIRLTQLDPLFPDVLLNEIVVVWGVREEAVDPDSTWVT